MWNLPSAVWPPLLVDLARLPADLAWGRAWQQIRLQRNLFELLFQRPEAKAADQWVHWLRDGAASLACLPFDLARLQHAAGVLAGIWPRSLLESMRFERQLGTIEQLTLGPLARSA
jgi:hypothetical protein